MELNVEPSSLIHRTIAPRQGEPPYPGLLLLHGRGTDEEDLLPVAEQLDPRLFVVSARGPFAFPWGGYAWYEMAPQGVGFPAPETLYRSLELLEGFIGEIVEVYGLDPSRLYAGGFSQGAATAAALMLTLPHRIAGGMILSGYLPLDAGLPFQPDAAAGHPIFEAHGTLDPVIPIAWGRLTRDFLEGTPVDLTYSEYPIAHTIGSAEMHDLAIWFTSVLDGSRPG